MKYKLGDLCKIKHGYAFKGKYIVQEKTDYILVTPGNFKIGGGFKGDKFKFYNNPDDIPTDYILKPNSLVVTMTDLSVKSDTLGYSALIPNDNKIYLHNQRIGLVHDINESLILKDYLYWFMRTFKYQKSVVATQSGTAIHHTSPERILNIEIELPTLEEQKRIVSFLNSIEKKIELNLKIIDNLEEQLRKIFENEYFNLIDYNNIEQYEDYNLYDEFDVIDNRGKTPPLVDNSEYPIIDVRVLSGSNRMINYSDCMKFVSEDTYNTFFRNGHPKLNDVLISTVGSLAEMKLFLEDKGTIAQNVIALRHKHNYPLFMYQYMLAIRKKLISYDIGSVQPSIKVTQFMKETIYIQKDKKNIMKFEILARDYTQKIVNATLQNRVLERLIDINLSKVIFDEIDLDEVEIQ